MELSEEEQREALADLNEPLVVQEEDLTERERQWLAYMRERGRTVESEAPAPDDDVGIC